MAKFTVGCVPYINAIPLVYRFEELGDESPVKVIYEVPSRLPALLDSGQADAILVSSFDALTQPNRRIAEGVCIGSFGPVESVRLFSKVPFGEIQSLALDSSSMTSNALAQILLSEQFSCRPKVAEMAPIQMEMLATCDSCVLIGDAGMTAPSDGLYVLDLGEAWTDITGLPFVWAAWIGSERLTDELAKVLKDAFSGLSDDDIADCVNLAQCRSALPPERLKAYFLNSMRYDLDDLALQGLSEFRKRLLFLGFEASYVPDVVRQQVPTIA
jgi:chorismate dehydratase